MNNITFNGEGPIMQGTWYNPHTGDSFTVSDSFFQDDQYIVKTTDDRLLDYNFIKNYIKVEESSLKDIKAQFNKEESKLPPEVQSLMVDDDIVVNNNVNTLGNMWDMSLPATSTTTDTNNIIINKALSKRELPKINSSIKWPDCPEKEINMLVDLMDVDMDSIIKWYVSKMDLQEIQNNIHEAIRTHITKIIGHPQNTDVDDEAGKKKLKSIKKK